MASPKHAISMMVDAHRMQMVDDCDDVLELFCCCFHVCTMEGMIRSDIGLPNFFGECQECDGCIGGYFYILSCELCDYDGKHFITNFDGGRR
mmetsp:Transcript_8173/g.11227  ORF Transcript_8173/g.11227 Transcript_8173/m.11227 type:complete len:92 (+) Transcript_8173:1869-2144(+)